MQHAYFIIQGPIGDLILAQEKKITEQREAIFVALKSLAKEIECRTDTALFSRGTCVGILFPEAPGQATCAWKKVCDWKKLDSGAWWPKKNSKEGKRIASLLSAFKPMELENVFPQVNAGNVFEWKWNTNRVYIPRAYVLKNQAYVSIPYDEMRLEGPDIPIDISRQFTRIQPHEFQKAIDDHNASIKAQP